MQLLRGLSSFIVRPKNKSRDFVSRGFRSFAGLILGFSHPSTQASVGRHSKVVAVSVSEAKSISVHATKIQPSITLWAFFAEVKASASLNVTEVINVAQLSYPSATLVFRSRLPIDRHKSR
jgi:hypothetical protein